MTANNSKIKTDSITDWYNSFSKKIESLSKKLAEDEFPSEDLCVICETPIDRHTGYCECDYHL